MMQGMFDLPTVEKLSSWHGHERWICGKWLVLHGITSLEVRYDGMEIVRLQCDTIEQAVKARQALFVHLPTSTHEWQLYAALGLTDAQGIAADFQTPHQRMEKWLAWMRSL
jgi:hypothetical protein